MATSYHSEDFFSNSKVNFIRRVMNLRNPITLREMEEMWDLSIRHVLNAYTEEKGGGAFLSRYGPCIRCDDIPSRREVMVK